MSEIVKKEKDYEGVPLKQLHTTLGLGRGCFGHFGKSDCWATGVQVMLSLAFSSDAGRADKKKRK